MPSLWHTARAPRINQVSSNRILYLTDKHRVSPGYNPAFTRLLNKAGIARQQVVTTDIYNLVDKPLRKYGNRKLWSFDPAKLDKIKAVFDQRVNAINPKIIVVSCPAILGVLTNGDESIATIEKMRGGVYYYGPDRIPTIVVYPITAIHRKIDQRIIENEDGESDTQEPYKVQQGKEILNWDWQKVGRFFAGKQRTLPEFRYTVCRSLADCYAAREFLDSCVLISTDIETGHFPPQITCIGFTGLHESGVVHSYVFAFYNQFGDKGVFWKSQDDHVVAWTVCRDILRNPVLKTMQNGTYDCSYFVRDLLGCENYLLDSQFLWYSLYAELPKRLDFITSILLDNYQYWKDDIKGETNESVKGRAPSMEAYWRYNALDCYYTLFNTLYLVQILAKNPTMQFNYNDVFMRALSGLKMSMRGVKADYAKRTEHRERLTRERDEALDTFRFMIDEPEFNINSPPQKNSLLYDLLGLPMRNNRGRVIKNVTKAKANTPSAAAIPLKLAKSSHPLFHKIITQMESAMIPDKQLGNIFGRTQEDGSIKGGLYLPTGRMRTAFGAAGTETSRFNSKKSNFWDGGNVQNIRKEFRDWMVADEGCVFLDIDFSQSDDVFMSYESQDPEKIAVVESGRDAHAVNAELFFGMPYDVVVAGKKAGLDTVVHPITGVRQLTKKTVHGTNFQMAAYTLYVTMGRDAVVAAAILLGHKDAGLWDEHQLVGLCGKLMVTYRGKYKRLTKREYYADIARQLKDKARVVNAYGLTRIFLGDPRDNGTQREATAFVGQSDTASNMNRAMYEIDHGFIPMDFRDGANPDRDATPLRMNWDSHGLAFHLQVHDNFVAQLNLRNPRWKEAAHNLLYVMNRPVIIHGREVRIKAEAEIGLRWGKGMLDWDGTDEGLDSIADQLKMKGI